jgi:signal transduction histidine kinase
MVLTKDQKPKTKDQIVAEIPRIAGDQSLLTQPTPTHTHPPNPCIPVLFRFPSYRFCSFVPVMTTPIKSNKLSLYWKCQLTGWSMASFYWFYLGFTGAQFDPLLGLVQFLTDLAGYIWLTHLYRNFVLRHHWQDLPVNKLVVKMIPAILVMGSAYTLFTLLKIYGLRIWFVHEFSQNIVAFTKANGISVFVAGIRLMAIWLLAYHLYQYAQREIRLARENASLAIESRDAQLNNLSAQLNPHFLFNSLNTIKSLISRQPDTARRGIDLLSEVLRNSLYNGDALDITIQEEMEWVNDYLELQKLRMEERLQYAIEVDNDISSRRIPRLCILTLVENAMKHGIASSVTGGEIRISINQAECDTKITVMNNGVLPDTISENGIGLKNVKERLRLMYQQQASFEMHAEKDWVIVTILIPAIWKP